MPAIVGNIKIINISASSVVQFGDAIFLSPKSSTKTFAGSGSFNTGDFPVTNSGLSMTHTLDNDVVDDTATNAGIG